MGRQRLAGSRRRSVVLAAIAVPAAVLFTAGADVAPLTTENTVASVAQSVSPAVVPVADVADCCLEIVAAPPAFGWSPIAAQAEADIAQVQLVAASRWRVDDRPLLLPAGVAPERGLQVKTILVARAISATFPEISSIGGVRPDSLRWHPNGLALDVMIPNHGSSAGIALGNQIVAFVMKHAARFGMQDAIWRGTYYTPAGAAGSGGYGHYDHVHITTTGGGYPTGGEVYHR
jgi:hypothetical protein